MNLHRLEVLLLVALVFVNVISCVQHDNEEEHEHHDGESEDDHDDEDHHGRYEFHHLDQDPHESDPDYDEDVLTGTSHHEKRDAEKTKRDMEELFKLIDKNNDSKIARDELLSHITSTMKQLHNESTGEEFEKIDTNMDKKMSLDEYFIFEHHDTLAVMENLTSADNSTETLELRKRIQHEKDRFKAADNDGDGFLTEHEYLLFKYPAFFPHMSHTVIYDYVDALDTNSDGTIDKKEYVSHFDTEDSKDKDAKEKSQKIAEEEFVKYDTNNDGKIDAEEYLAVLKPGYEDSAKSEADYLFKESDSDKDGLLTLHEIENNSHAWLGGPSLDESDLDDDDVHGGHFDDEL